MLRHIRLFDLCPIMVLAFPRRKHYILAMLLNRFFAAFAFVALSLTFPLSAATTVAENVPLVVLDPAKTYLTVNGEPITGNDVLNLIIEQSWEKELSSFIQHQLCVDEIKENKIVVTDEEVNAELKKIIEEYAKRVGLNAADVTLEALVKKFGLPGGIALLQRDTRDMLGMLKLLKSQKKIPEKIGTRDPNFTAALQSYLENVIKQKGVVRDATELGTGEAVRIGGKGYSRDEVRAFLAEGLGQISADELKGNLEILKLEKIVQGALITHKKEIADEDLNFHYSYLCREREANSPGGIPGHTLMQQDLSERGTTPKQFIRNRIFKIDAGLTLMAREPIGARALHHEFDTHPERYKRSENLIAHIFVRVLDSEGRPYTSLWKVPNAGPVNAYVADKREEQFTSYKPKIEKLEEQAKADFEGTAKKFSDDLVTASVGGKLGRIGAQTIVSPPCDAAVRDVAAKLKPGEVSKPVRSDYGWHLLKCLDKQEVTYEEAAERIYVRLIHESREQLVKKLTEDAKVEEK
jgi:hypothetical protein